MLPPADAAWVIETDADVILPVPGPGGAMLGLLVVGRRFNGRIVRCVDIPFLEALGGAAGLTVARLRLMRVAEREELTETGLGSPARCCGRRRHRQANSVRVCSPTSRRVASLSPRSAGLTALTPAPRTLVQIGSCRQCSLIHPLHVVVDVPSRMTLFRATADTLRKLEPLGQRTQRFKADSSLLAFLASL